MKVTICMGARCTLMGANAIYDAVEYLQDHLCGPESEALFCRKFGNWICSLFKLLQNSQQRSITSCNCRWWDYAKGYCSRS